MIDITVRQQLESYFRSIKDRLRNADQPDQMRPKEKVKRLPLKGTARSLYLNNKVKLSKANMLAQTQKLGPAKKEK